MYRSFQAAKTICFLSDWKISNLPLEKVLYLAHMFCLGERGRALVDGRFEAWDLGPVEPNVYHRVKPYGRAPIPDIFPTPMFAEGGDDFQIVKEVYDQVKDMKPGTLVAITHDKEGAWAQYYRPNTRGIVIPNHAIAEEYARRLARTGQRAG